MQIIYELRMTTKYEYIDKYLLEIRAKGRYSFTFDELNKAFDVSEQAIRRKINRLKNAKKIAIIRKDFYVVLPPESMASGSLSPYLYIDDLMKELNRDYYVALYSAAALYGAAHQQPMDYQIIVGSPLRKIKQGNVGINFFVRKEWQQSTIVQKQSAAGYFNVSSPELTALDFTAFNGKIGGISRILPILSELIENIEPKAMYQVAKYYPQTSALQRLGYLFSEVIDRQDLANSIQRVVKNRATQNILLSISSPKKKNINRDWKVDVNLQINNEL